MKRYTVTKGPATFGPGQSMQLTEAQVASRRHNLEAGKADAKSKLITVKTTGGIEFKTGEVIGLPEVERRLQAILAPVDAPEPKAAA